ncbi:MAG: hypothetical protein ABIO70_30035 [Pseudomonadota bacterium]
MFITVILLLAGCTFECGGKALETIPASAVCDGVIDCWGGQDERTDGCTTELVFCDDIEPEAILAEQRCDGVEDCSQGEDEAECEGD